MSEQGGEAEMEGRRWMGPSVVCAAGSGAQSRGFSDRLFRTVLALPPRSDKTGLFARSENSS